MYNKRKWIIVFPIVLVAPLFLLSFSGNDAFTYSIRGKSPIYLGHSKGHEDMVDYLKSVRR